MTETNVIPFDFERWKSGQYKKLVTTWGRGENSHYIDVDTLVYFQRDDSIVGQDYRYSVGSRLVGLTDGQLYIWNLQGKYVGNTVFGERDEYIQEGLGRNSSHNNLKMILN